MRDRPRRRWQRRLGVAALALVGCASDCDGNSEPGTIGELGNGRFLYVCTGSSDPVCEFESNNTFPDCIALGGAFDLEYMLLDTSLLGPDELTPVIYVESVNQGFFRGDDDFEALRTGRAAFLVREEDSVLDLLHLDIVEPDAIEISARDPATPVDTVRVEVGEDEVFRVFPRSSRCEQLGGAIPIVAESSDESVATISDGDVLRIQGQGEGTAVIRVRLGDIEEAMTVEVVAGAFPPSTSTGPEPGTSGDSSGGDDSGTSTGGTDSGTSTGGSTSGSTGGGT